MDLFKHDVYVGFANSYYQFICRVHSASISGLVKLLESLTRSSKKWHDNTFPIKDVSTCRSFIICTGLNILTVLPSKCSICSSMKPFDLYFDKRFRSVWHSDLHNFVLFISHGRKNYEIKVHKKLFFDFNLNYIIHNLKKDLFSYCLEPNLNSGQFSRSGIFSELQNFLSTLLLTHFSR